MALGRAAVTGRERVVAAYKAATRTACRRTRSRGPSRDVSMGSRSRPREVCGTTHQIHEDPVDVGFVAITIDLDQQADPALKVDQLDRLLTLGNQRGVIAIGNVDERTRSP